MMNEQMSGGVAFDDEGMSPEEAVEQAVANNYGATDSSVRTRAPASQPDYVLDGVMTDLREIARPPYHGSLENTSTDVLNMLRHDAVFLEHIAPNVHAAKLELPSAGSPQGYQADHTIYTLALHRELMTDPADLARMIPACKHAFILWSTGALPYVTTDQRLLEMEVQDLGKAGQTHQAYQSLYEMMNSEDMHPVKGRPRWIDMDAEPFISIQKHAWHVVAWSEIIWTRMDILERNGWECADPERVRAVRQWVLTMVKTAVYVQIDAFRERQRLTNNLQ